MPTPNVLVLRAPGTNCDGETAFAFERAGAAVTRAHVNRLRGAPHLLADAQVLVLPGGFSYGDDLGAGKLLAAQLQRHLADAVRRFRDDDKLVLGVCNGFQALLKAGLLVPPDDDGPLATLAANTSGRFHDRWVALTARPGNCPFLTGVDRMFVPVAHGEGRFVGRADWIVRGLQQSGQVVLTYATPADNPNGSAGGVAGLCDTTGRVLGLMPHPERHVLGVQSPRWARDGLKPEGDGMAIFRNAVDYFKQF